LSSDPGTRRAAARTAIPAVLAVLALAAVVAAAAEPAVFSGERAMAWLEYQCALGPRIPGSPGHAALQAAIAAHADSLGLEFRRQPFTTIAPDDRGEMALCNLVISSGPPGGERLWIGAHYDTRPFCDLETDPALAAQPLPGANDGASGVAVLLHLAELLAAEPPPRGVDLIFFDGEDGGRAGETDGFCLGARHLAATWKSFGSPLAGGRPLGLIVLDMVGARGLDVPVENLSARLAPAWTSLVFARAADLGLDAFSQRPGSAVFDDHVPFLQAGVPAVDLIDFDFPEWHTTRDLPAVCDPRSLAQAGALVWSIARRPLRR